MPSSEVGFRAPARLSDDHLARLRRLGLARGWVCGDVLWSEGDRGDHLVVVNSGTLKATRTAAGGRQVSLAFRSAGAVVGELSVLDGRRRSATITAISPMAGTVVTAAAFQKCLAADGELAVGLLTMIVDRLREADRGRLNLTSMNISARIAEFLLTFAYRDQPDQQVVALTQSELADAVGASRESVVKALRQFRDMGAVATGRGRIAILRHEALQEFLSSLTEAL